MDTTTASRIARRMAEHGFVTTTQSLSITVGRMIRASVRRELREAAVEMGVEVTLTEERGFVNSLIIVDVEGTDRRVRAYVDAVVRAIG